MERSMWGRKWSQVTIQGEAKPGRSVYKVECLIHCNDNNYDKSKLSERKLATVFACH